MSISGEFQDLPAEDRAAAQDAACERAGRPGGNFWDLDPEDRAAAYERQPWDGPEWP